MRRSSPSCNSSCTVTPSLTRTRMQRSTRAKAVRQSAPVAAHTTNGQAPSVASASDGASSPDVPERPRLADGVTPAGQMRESAFVDPPWLIDRRGQGYVQVTELLHRIAEVLDGQHTHEQI